MIESAKHDRFCRTNFCTGRNESALLAVVTERALKCAAGIGKWLWSAIDHAERTRHHAIAAAVANIILHEHRANFSTHDCTGGTCLQTARVFAMLADVRQKNPPERILVQ